MSGTGLLFAALLLPWLLAGLTAVPASRSWAARLLILAPWPALALLLLELAGSGTRVVLGPFSFATAGPGLPLVLASVGAWALLLPYARAWAPGDRVDSLTGWLLVTLATHLIALLADNLLTFYAGFALTSFAAWGLILLGEGARVPRAAGTYMIMMLVAELGLLTGLAAVAASNDFSFGAATDGRLQGVALLAFGLGCAIKMGVLGVHIWLPLAHGSAPLPASALLSGLLVKLGLLAWLLVADGLYLPPAGQTLLWLGLVAATYGVGAGLLERAPKRILAFSTISQMGLLTTGVGMLLVMQDPVTTAVTNLALHHAVHKVLAFLALGLLLSRQRHNRQLGVAALAWVLWSLAGAPFSSGADTKQALELQLQAAGEGQLARLLILTSVLTALLLGHLARQALDQARQHADARPDQPAWLGWPVATLLLACLALPLISPIGWYSGALWPLLAAIPGWFWNRGRTPDQTAGSFRWARIGVRLERQLQRWELMGRCLLLLAVGLLAALWLAH